MKQTVFNPTLAPKLKNSNPGTSGVAVSCEALYISFHAHFEKHLHFTYRLTRNLKAKLFDFLSKPSAVRRNQSLLLCGTCGKHPTLFSTPRFY